MASEAYKILNRGLDVLLKFMELLDPRIGSFYRLVTHFQMLDWEDDDEA